MTRWQTFYLDDPSLVAIPSSECVKRAKELFTQHQKRLILDLGCGVGRDTAYLADGMDRVIGIDAAHSGLILAQERFKLSRTQAALVEGDARQLPFPTAIFEGIYCFGVLHEFTTATAANDVRQVMEEIYRILRPDGLLILTTLSGDPQQGLPHVRLFTEQMFTEAFESFQVLEKREYADRGCTGKQNYRVWYGAFTKS